MCRIIGRADSYVYLVDCYADQTIFDYVSTEGNTTKISKIRILSQNNIDKLRMARAKFIRDNPSIDVQIRKSRCIHDRYLFIDSEVWHSGASIKDGGSRASTLIRLENTAAVDARKMFDDIWNKAKST